MADTEAYSVHMPQLTAPSSTFTEKSPNRRDIDLFLQKGKRLIPADVS